MKVLIASTNGVFHDGITAWMILYFSAMNREGIEPHAFTWPDTEPGIIAKAEAAGIIVHTLPSRRTSTKAYLCGLDELLAHERFDAIHVCGNSATMTLELALARKNSVRMRIAHVHNTTCDHRVVDKLLRPAFYGLLTHRLACGKAAGLYMYGNRAFTVMPNGNDPEVYRFDPEKRSAMRRSLGISDGQIAIGHVGNFNTQKNHSLLLEIFAAYRKSNPAARLFMIGDGDLFEDVCEKAEAMGLGDSAVFLGWRSDVPELLQAMDLMLLPSLYEGLPNVIIEWQYAGLPCVMSDTITDECVATPLVTKMSLEAPASSWVAMIERKLAKADRARDCAEAATALGEAGYDVRECAAKLRKLYLEGVC